MTTSSEEDFLPIIKQYNYNVDTKEEILKRDKHNDYITRYPTVYIVIDKLSGRKNVGKFKAYVGETNNIVRRTEQHLKSESSSREDWTALNSSKHAKLIVIAHREFNKSLTLDIENKLMQYLVSDDSIAELNNRRSNDQDLYYTHDRFKFIFEEIWKGLSEKREDIFPDIDDIKNSAIFKASPFHKLTDEQIDARDKIIEKVNKIENTKTDDNLIVVKGSAGTGKTVLLSSLFAELNTKSSNQEAYVIVNHDQQLKVYENIANKLGIKSKFGDDIANKPTMFLNRHPVNDEKKNADIVLVDEAHLLLTQGYMAYRRKNQLDDLKKVSKVVVAVLDPYQVLKSNGYMEKDYYDKIFNNAQKHGNLIELNQQNRMMANDDTINWIDNIIENRKISEIPEDDKYDLRVFDNIDDMYSAIKEHDGKNENLVRGLSRMVATYDWEFKNKPKPTIDEETGDSYWRVKIGDNFNLPWNNQIPVEKKFKELAWAEQPQTINEVGSTFTIQGFDLNYCGLIIGPSVKYRDGKIVFDKNYSYDKQATNKRTMDNGDKKDVSDELIRNELNVLMKRGVHGLYIYAVDDALRNELLKMSK